MQLKDLHIGTKFKADYVDAEFEKIEPVELDGVMRNVVFISETNGLMVKGLKIFLHPETTIETIL